MEGYWECLSKGLCGFLHPVTSSPDLDDLKAKAAKHGIKKFIFKKIRVS